MPLVLTVIVYMTETGLDYINFLGAGAVILMLVGGIGAVSERRIFNSLKVGLGFFFSCLSLFAWLMVANNNFQVELGIVSSFLAFAMIYRSLEFYF